MSDTYTNKLIGIIKGQEWLITALKNVRDLGLPEAYIGGGAIRTTVWNYLYGYPTDSHLNDVDVTYFDPSDMKGEKEKPSQEILKRKQPDLEWEVINQARVYLFVHDGGGRTPQAHSIYEAVSCWCEPASCVAVRLKEDGEIDVCAPYGLEDLFNFVVKPVDEKYHPLVCYKNRISTKKWVEYWPKLRITM